MSRQTLSIVALVAGIALVVLGATWSYWRSPKSLWSPEQATEYNEAWRALKTAATGGVRRGDPGTDPKVAAAQARFDAINTQLEHAKTVNSYAGTVFIAVGVIIIAISAWLISSLGATKQSAA